MQQHGVVADQEIIMFSYRKVGGLHFWRIGRLGGMFYIAKRSAPACMDGDQYRLFA